MKLIRDSLTRCLVLVLALVAAPTSLARDQVGFMVIVHESNPAESVTENQLSKIFLKKTLRWEHSVGADPVDQDDRSPVRVSFTKTIHGRSVSSIQRFWQRQIFSGQAFPPPEVGSDQEVIEYVGQTPGAVGYVSSEAELDRDVKVLEIVDPLDDY